MKKEEAREDHMTQLVANSFIEHMKKEEAREDFRMKLVAKSLFFVDMKKEEAREDSLTQLVANSFIAHTKMRKREKIIILFKHWWSRTMTSTTNSPPESTVFPSVSHLRRRLIPVATSFTFGILGNKLHHGV
jgi:hypothetical protein